MDIYPVIHCVDPYRQHGISHALENTKISFDAGARGVFLIGHEISPFDLVEIYNRVRNECSSHFIGINFLGIRTPEELARVMRSCPAVSALWMDHVFVGARGAVGEIPIWGGIAFKYKNPNPTQGELCAEVANLRKESVDVAVTSGSKTGQSPTLEKIQRINTAIAGVGWDVPLGIASGISTKNVSHMREVYAGLVASSICKTDEHGHEWIISEKLRALVAAAS